jgi:hypothetical protein
MLRRIKAEQLQVGMFVARLGGPWINHPFWRSRFLVTSDEQVEQIQAANVQDVWIDILKGRNLPMPSTPEDADSRWMRSPNRASRTNSNMRAS